MADQTALKMMSTRAGMTKPRGQREGKTRRLQHKHRDDQVMREDDEVGEDRFQHQGEFLNIRALDDTSAALKGLCALENGI